MGGGRSRKLSKKTNVNIFCNICSQTTGRKAGTNFFANPFHATWSTEKWLKKDFVTMGLVTKVVHGQKQ